jgi:hypothetical protein
MQIKRRIPLILTLILGLALGSSLIFFTGFRLGKISPQEAGERVKELYELATGTSVEIVGVLEESGMYKVILRTTDFLGRTAMLEVYVSQDGKLLSEAVLKAQEFKSTLENQRNFVDCLALKGVRIYGISNGTATLLQLRTLGGRWFVGKIYLDCTGEGLQACIDAGVEVLPSIVYEGKVYQGVKTIDWFEEKTGCKFGG